MNRHYHNLLLKKLMIQLNIIKLIFKLDLYMTYIIGNYTLMCRYRAGMFFMECANGLSVSSRLVWKRPL